MQRVKTVFVANVRPEMSALHDDDVTYTYSSLIKHLLYKVSLDIY